MHLFKHLAVVVSRIFTADKDINAGLNSLFSRLRRVESVSIQAVGLDLGVDGQEERGALIGFEGGRNDQVLSGLQPDEFHHFAGVHEGFRLGYRSLRAEKRGWELSNLSFVLKNQTNTLL